MLEFRRDQQGYTVVDMEWLVLGAIRKIPGAALDSKNKHWFEPAGCILQDELITIGNKLKELNENIS